MGSKLSGCFVLLAFVLLGGNICRSLFVFCIVWLAVSCSPEFLQVKLCICLIIFIVCIRVRLVLQTSRLLGSWIPPGGILLHAFW